MTRWVNLGRGLTQDDIMWKNQVACSDFRRNTTPLPDYLVTHPHLCFEDMAPEPFEKLRSRNLSYLRNDRYQTAMTHFPSFSYTRGDLWFTWHKKAPRIRAHGFCDTLRWCFHWTRKRKVEEHKCGKSLNKGSEVQIRPQTEPFPESRWLLSHSKPVRHPS